LARDLGVKSSAIVEKCQAEGLDVKNHMAAISAGLAATIREWFSEGENVTTVETADKVDLTDVRVKRPLRKKVLDGEEPLTPEEVAAAAIEEEEPIVEEEEVVEEGVAPPPPEVVPPEPPAPPVQVEVPAPTPVVVAPPAPSAP